MSNIESTEVLDVLNKAINDLDDILNDTKQVKSKLYNNFLQVFAISDAVDTSGENKNYYQTVAEVNDNPKASSEDLEESWGFRTKTDGAEDTTNIGKFENIPGSPTVLN